MSLHFKKSALIFLLCFIYILYCISFIIFIHIFGAIISSLVLNFSFLLIYCWYTRNTIIFCRFNIVNSIIVIVCDFFLFSKYNISLANNQSFTSSFSFLQPSFLLFCISRTTLTRISDTKHVYLILDPREYLQHFTTKNDVCLKFLCILSDLGSSLYSVSFLFCLLSFCFNLNVF